jgi:hypothetical protein
MFFLDDEALGNKNDNSEILLRHYKSLGKEMKKKNPDVMIVNTYLNKEFQARRDWLENIAAENRCQQLLAMYPCFTDHVEVGLTSHLFLVLLFSYYLVSQIPFGIPKF